MASAQPTGYDAFVATPFGALTIATLCQALPPGTDPEAAYAAFAAFDAQDPVEQMLAMQAVAAHFAAMACFAQAMRPDADPRTADRACGRAAAMARTMRDAAKMLDLRRKRAMEAVPTAPEPPEPKPFVRPREILPNPDGTAATAGPALGPVKVLNGDPVRDFMSRRFAPGDDMEGAWSNAQRESAETADAEGS
jgi:hypothetical protein